MSSAAGRLDPRRAVQLRADRSTGPRLSSGYQVAADLVITAAHGVADARELSIRFVDATGSTREVAGSTVLILTAVDLAVVRLAAADPGLSPVVYGYLSGTAACEAVGYPWFKLRDEHAARDTAHPGAHRDSHHARGTGSSYSNRRSGTLELTVTAPMAHPDPDRSAWEGMSGAAVFADNRLIGVISENYGHEGPGWLSAQPVSAWYHHLSEEQFGALQKLLALPARGRLAEIGRHGGVRGGDGLRQLPPDTALFTGRSRQVQQVIDHVDNAGHDAAPGTVVISAIVGLGGIGKTAFAVHVAHQMAHRFPDGQLYLDLHGTSADTPRRDPGDALADLLGALGLAPERIPPSLDARAALYRQTLAATRTLILLDNAADEGQVRPLLPAADTCLVLVTSRKRLAALDDASLVPLDVLPVDESIALLRRAARLAPDTGDRPLLEEVIDLCGRLPLALVIAGGLLRTGGDAWNLRRLTDHLQAERPGRELAAYDDGMRKLAEVFDLSYDALTSTEQLLYRRLGVLPGASVDAYAAAALTDTDPAVAEHLLQRLADHSLVDGYAPGRYHIHNLVHTHARTLLATDPNRDAASERLFRYYAHTAQTASQTIARLPRPGPHGPTPAHSPALTEPDSARTWLRTEHSNLHAAYTQACSHNIHPRTIDLAAGLAEILRIDGPWTHALNVHQAAADAAERTENPTAHATALNDLGRVQYLIGDYPGAADAHLRALAISRTIGNQLGEANALNDLGRVRLVIGDFPDALDAHTQALEIFRTIGNHLGEANSLNDWGRVRYLLADFPQAVGAHAQALEIFRAIGNSLGEANALHDLGRVQLAIGEVPAATQAHTRALEIFRAIGNSLGEGNALNDLGYVRSLAGDHTEATDALNHALRIFQEIGHRLGEANALAYLGRVRYSIGEYAEAIRMQAQAVEIYREIGERGNEAWALNQYAATLASTGARHQAIAVYFQALTMNRELRKPDDEAISLEGIGDHCVATGEARRGTEFFHQALEIYRRLGMHSDSRRVRTKLP